MHYSLWHRLSQRILSGIQRYAFLWPPPSPPGPVESGVHILPNEFVDFEASGDLRRVVFVPRELVEQTGCGTLNVKHEQFFGQIDFCNTTIGKLSCCAQQYVVDSCHVRMKTLHCMVPCTHSLDGFLHHAGSCVGSPLFSTKRFPVIPPFGLMELACPNCAEFGVSGTERHLTIRLEAADGLGSISVDMCTVLVG